MSTSIDSDPDPKPATAFVPHRYVDPPFPEGRFVLSKRRLKDIPRAIQRPLECHLQSLRRLGDKSAVEISSRLDLHPDDFDALAATGGTF